MDRGGLAGAGRATITRHPEISKLALTARAKERSNASKRILQEFVTYWGGVLSMERKYSNHGERKEFLDVAMPAKQMNPGDCPCIFLHVRFGREPRWLHSGLYDPDTGLVRLGVLDYDPEPAKWLAKDPVGFGAIWH